MIELPQSPETEAAVIAAWFSQEKFAAAWRPTPTLFAGVTNRVLVEAMAELSLATRDQVSLAAVLATRGSLERVGGTQGVFRAINLAPSVGDPWPHVERLTRYAALRNLLVGIETASATGARTHDLEATTTDVQAALRAAVGMSGVKPLSVAELLEAAAIDAMRVGMPVERCPTGIPAFDQDSGGLRPEHVAVMGAATNYGKSSLAIMLADESLRSGRGVLIATFEDAPELYGRRLLARRAQVNAFRLREHLLRDDELERVKVTAEKGERQPFLLDARGRAAEHVASDVRSLCASDGLALVLVDYVQAARTETARQDRRNEVTYVARVLTDAIKTSHAAGVLFSQIRRLLSRGERPTKFDLKESGDVENAAELVMIGYEDEQSRRCLAVDKCKDGEKGTYQLFWDGNACCFTGGRRLEGAGAEG